MAGVPSPVPVCVGDSFCYWCCWLGAGLRRVVAQVAGPVWGPSRGSGRVAPRAKSELGVGATRPLEVCMCATRPEPDGPCGARGRSSRWACVPQGYIDPTPRRIYRLTGDEWLFIACQGWAAAVCVSCSVIDGLGVTWLSAWRGESGAGADRMR